MKRTVFLLSVVVLGTLLSAPGARGQWVQTNGPGAVDISALIEHDKILFAGTDGPNYTNIMTSTDSGRTWNPMSPARFEYSNALPVTSLLSQGKYVFAIPEEGLFRSSDSGRSWTELDTGLHVTVYDVAANDSFLFIGTDAGPTAGFLPGGFVYRSSDEGERWQKVTVGLPFAFVRALAVVGNCVLAATDSGVFRSTNNGTSWAKSNDGLPETFWNGVVSTFGTIGTYCFAAVAMYDSGIYCSKDSGKSWVKVQNGLPPMTVNSFATNGRDLFVCGRGVYQTTDSGLTWSNASATLPPGLTVSCLVGIGNLLEIGLQPRSTTVPSGTLITPLGVYRSTDSGQTWTTANTGMSGDQINGLVVMDSGIYAAGGGLYRSINSGGDWSLADSGIRNSEVYAIAAKGSTLFASAETVLRSSNEGETWIPSDTGLPIPIVTTFLVNDSEIFAGSNGGVFVSQDGSNWVPRSEGLSNAKVYTLARNGRYLFAGTYGSGMFRSSNDGASWYTSNSGIDWSEVYYLACNGAFIFASVSNDTNGKLFAWSDFGDNWKPIEVSLSGNELDIGGVFAISDRIFVATDSGLLVTSDNGGTWASANIGLPNSGVISLTAFGDELFAGTYDRGVWRRPLSDFGISSVAPQQQISAAPISVFPNPIAGRTTIAFTTASPGYADVRLMNAMGVEVARVFSGELSAGEHSLTWSAPPGLAAGMFECVVRINGGVEDIPIIVTQ